MVTLGDVWDYDLVVPAFEKLMSYLSVICVEELDFKSWTSWDVVPEGLA